MAKQPGVKIDLYREHKSEYAAKKTPAVVEVGPVLYLSVDGRGEPGDEAFQTGVQALYGAAFTIKMTRKFAGLGDYKVCGLEGLWWTDEKKKPFWEVPRKLWRWKLMIRTPEFIGQKDLDEARAALIKKGRPASAAIEMIEEGPCVQALHVGPYATEPETIGAMHAFAAEHGYKIHGLHHEIYLNDPRRVPPERLKTILRQPVKK